MGTLAWSYGSCTTGGPRGLLTVFQQFLAPYLLREEILFKASALTNLYNCISTYGRFVVAENIIHTKLTKRITTIRDCFLI